MHTYAKAQSSRCYGDAVSTTPSPDVNINGMYCAISALLDHYLLHNGVNPLHSAVGIMIRLPQLLPNTEPYSAHSHFHTLAVRSECVSGSTHTTGWLAGRFHTAHNIALASDASVSPHLSPHLSVSSPHLCPHLCVSSSVSLSLSPQFCLLSSSLCLLISVSSPHLSVSSSLSPHLCLFSSLCLLICLSPHPSSSLCLLICLLISPHLCVSSSLLISPHLCVSLQPTGQSPSSSSRWW